MKFRGISIWRCTGIRDNQETVVDLLLADSDFLQSALARKRQISFGGQNICVLTLEDLMLMKMIAGRLQDRADLERIAQAELQVDRAYIEQWRSKLGLDKR
jgi:predicted nucleotidyltransferase